MDHQNYSARIKHQVEELKLNIARQQVELDELQTALKVLKRLENKSFDVDADFSSARQTRKTVSDIVLDVLNRSNGIESAALAESVSQQNGASANTIFSTLSRMKKQGLIDNKDRRWILSVASPSPLQFNHQSADTISSSPPSHLTGEKNEF